MNIQINSVIKLLFCSQLLFFIFFIPSGFASSDSDKKNMLNNYVQSMINDYKNRIVVNQIEVLDIKKDLEWLNCKIKRANYSNRHISGGIQTSHQYKTSKISALEKKIKYCRERLNYFQNQTTVFENRERNTFSNDFIKKLQANIKKSDLSGWLEIKQDEKNSKSYQLKTVLPILFASGSAEIINEYDFFLKNLATLVKDFADKIVVDGYADIDPIHTKQYPSNFELGALRAANIVHSLIKYGVKPSAFKIATTGKYRLLPQKMTKNKSLERYVDITVFIAG